MRSSSKIAALLICILAVFPRSGFAQQKKTSEEQFLFDSANRSRAAQGLPPLEWSDSLARAAHTHALRMAQMNSLSHQFPGEAGLESRATQAGARFSSIAENVAEGPSAATIHAMWMNSAPHRANLLNSDSNSLGLAVIERDGQFFAVEDFSHAIEIMSVEEQEKSVGAILQAHGLRLLGESNLARQVCALGRNYSNKRQPYAEVRYQTSDLKALPDILAQKIRSGRYRSAEVGACQSEKSSGFSGYRLAVLLYE
ncbi:MAG: CAP domain-containing protein [Candidatus Acidiferrales bacterium]